MIPAGWSEAWPGGMLTNPAPDGGIIDVNRISGTWFVIFNDRRESIDELPSREAAVEYFVSQLELPFD